MSSLLLFVLVDFYHLASPATYSSPVSFCLDSSGLGYCSTVLWKLPFLAGMGPVTRQCLMLRGICVCAVAGGSVYLLSEVQ